MPEQDLLILRVLTNHSFRRVILYMFLKQHILDVKYKN